jgi:hypothetical protein
LFVASFIKIEDVKRRKAKKIEEIEDRSSIERDKKR